MAIVSILLGGVLGLFAALIACIVFQTPVLFGMGLYFTVGLSPLIAMNILSWIVTLRDNSGLAVAHHST